MFVKQNVPSGCTVPWGAPGSPTRSGSRVSVTRIPRGTTSPVTGGRSRATFPMRVNPGIRVKDTFSTFEFPTSIETRTATAGIGGGPVAAGAAAAGGAQGFGGAAELAAPGAGGAPRGPAAAGGAFGAPGAAIAARFAYRK